MLRLSNRPEIAKLREACEGLDSWFDRKTSSYFGCGNGYLVKVSAYAPIWEGAQPTWYFSDSGEMFTYKKLKLLAAGVLLNSPDC